MEASRYFVVCFLARRLNDPRNHTQEHEQEEHRVKLSTIKIKILKSKNAD
jgi:hypothetical protein